MPKDWLKPFNSFKGLPQCLPSSPACGVPWFFLEGGCRCDLAQGDGAKRLMLQRWRTGCSGVLSQSPTLGSLFGIQCIVSFQLQRGRHQQSLLWLSGKPRAQTFPMGASQRMGPPCNPGRCVSRCFGHVLDVSLKRFGARLGPWQGFQIKDTKA